MNGDVSIGHCTARVTVRCHASVAEIDAHEWETVSRGQVFLSMPYLGALSEAAVPMAPVSFWQADVMVGAALFQLASFDGAPLKSYVDFRCGLLALIARPIRALKAPFQTWVLVCGTPFAAGPHGFAFRDNIPTELAGAALAKGAQMVSARLGKDVPIAGVLFKEFCDDAAPMVGGLEQRRYVPFETDPALVLSLDSRWRGFDDYLTSMSSKYRVKAKRAYTLSEHLVDRDLTPDDLARYRDRVADLYGQVAARAPYKLGRLDTDTLTALRTSMGRAFVLKGYFLGDTLVGFLMAFENGDTLDAGLVGIDYGLNKAHAIYPRMLYDYLKTALDRRLRKVNYGRTAGEIKSTLGAIPVTTRCCLRLQNTSLNAVLPIFKSSLRPTAFAVRKPFKQEWYARRTAPVGAYLTEVKQSGGA